MRIRSAIFARDLETAPCDFFACIERQHVLHLAVRQNHLKRINLRRAVCCDAKQGLRFITFIKQDKPLRHMCQFGTSDKTLRLNTKE